MTEILPLQNPPGIRGGLASILAQLVGRDGQPLDVAGWSKGVEWTNMAAGETFVAGFGGGSFGIYANDDVKPTVVNPVGAQFEPVALGAIYRCQMNAPGGTLGDVSKARAESLLERRTSADLANLLAAGEAYPCGAPDGSQPNPSLQSTAVLPEGFDGITPGSIRGALQGLLDGVCGAPGGNPGWNSDPVFHIPRSYMPHFLGDVVHWSELEGKFKFGPHDVSFDCYPNVEPQVGGTTAVDGSEVWIYATLRPQAAMSEIESALVRTHLQNDYDARAERQAIIAFDTTLVMAAKALVG